MQSSSSIILVDCIANIYGCISNDRMSIIIVVRRWREGDKLISAVLCHVPSGDIVSHRLRVDQSRMTCAHRTGVFVLTLT